MSTIPFDSAAVAYYEVEGWKAYYDRDWLRLLRLVIALAGAQFHIPFPLTVVAAYHITRASVAWVPKKHNPEALQQHLKRFYRLARRYSGLQFDIERAASLELQYWDVHRRLVGQADKTDFIEIMTQLHAIVFGLSEADARESAELRVEANNVLDTITGHTATDPEQDWLRCRVLLEDCYTSLRKHTADQQHIAS